MDAIIARLPEFVQVIEAIRDAGIEDIGIVVGDTAPQIKEAAGAAGADISGARIIPLEGTEQAGELALKLYELRKHKGLTEEKAFSVIEGVIFPSPFI